MMIFYELFHRYSALLFISINSNNIQADSESIVGTDLYVNTALKLDTMVVVIIFSGVFAITLCPICFFGMFKSKEMKLADALANSPEHKRMLSFARQNELKLSHNLEHVVRLSNTHNEGVFLKKVTVADIIMDQCSSVTAKNDKRNLLLVDIPADITSVLTMTLSDEYYVSRAANEQEGFAMASLEFPDVIIIGNSGIDNINRTLLSRLSEEITTNHIPVIFLNSSDTKQYRLKAFELGCIDCVCIPFDLNELKFKMRNAIDKQTAALRHYLHPDVQVIQDIPIIEETGTVLLKRLENYLNKNYQNKGLSIERLSRNVFMCERQFQRKLKSLVGQTPTEYLRHFRLERACEFMQQGYSGIAVSEMVGFSSYSYFSRTFKATYKTNPSDYIELHHNSQTNASEVA